ncbi:MAG: CDP-alcohol phosphatidyltransferase family protein [Bacilli bacterium]|nr:CDP-alcohol phosphatidyltransferase family protein [Bacilli bacterium]
MVRIVAFLIVNALTAVRIIGVFCLVPIYHRHGGAAAAVLSILCYFTDFLDGMIARKCKVVSFFGSMFDGVADKAFTVANLLVLLTITKFALIPIFFEIAIVIIQTVKFGKGINVQGSMTGKIKTWIIALTVIALYLVTDIKHIFFLSNSFINKISSLKQDLLIGFLSIPIMVFEVLTIISYLLFLKTYNPIEKKDIPNIDTFLIKPKNSKDKINNYLTVWLNYDFYLKYKDSCGLNSILKQVKAMNNIK